MKRMFLLLAILSLLLCGCAQQATAETIATATAPLPPVPVATMPSEPTVASSEEPMVLRFPGIGGPSPQSEAFYATVNRRAPEILAYRDVLEGDLKVVNPFTSSSASLTNYLKWYDPEQPLKVVCLTVVDLDQDGSLEAILRTGLEGDSFFGFEILRYDQGLVYVYNSSYRAFDQLKTDGTSRLVADHSGWHYGGYRFDGASWGTVTGQIFAGDTTEALAAQAAHEEKPDVIWFQTWAEFYNPGSTVSLDQVLSGEAAFLDVFTGDPLTIHQAGQLLAPEEAGTQLGKGACVDLDGDGRTEVILEILQPAGDCLGYAVLTQQNGQVYGRGWYHRAFQELKADGTYRGSGSAFNRYYHRLWFENGNWVEMPLGEAYQESDGTPVYIMSGSPTDEARFLAFERSQSQKEDALWFDLVS